MLGALCACSCSEARCHLISSLAADNLTPHSFKALSAEQVRPFPGRLRRTLSHRMTLVPDRTGSGELVTHHQRGNFSPPPSR